MARELSIMIPARNEMFLKRTVDNILENIEADTEIIVVLDGDWPDPPIEDNPRVIIIHYSQSIGQRAATNVAARMSSAKYVMKVDAHCAFDKGFDRKLIADCDYDMIVTPRLYNLHAFDLVCKKCGHRRYQSPTGKKCEKCEATDWEKDIIWRPRMNCRSDFYRFDKELKFQYWKKYEDRPEAKADIADTMSFLGAAWFCHRKHLRDLGWLDEKHTSWGQMGTEIACKSWLSGGRLVVNKKTWFSHMFRTQGGDFGFPYRIRQRDIDKAHEYSKFLWMGDGNWRGRKKTLQWILDKFAPIPDWHEEAPPKREREPGLPDIVPAALSDAAPEACEVQNG